MSKGLLFFAAHRPDSRLHLGLRDPLLSRCLLGLSPDHDERVRPAHNLIRHPIWFVLLRNHAFRSEERWRHLSKVQQQCFTDQIDPLDQLDQAERPKPTITVYVDDIVVKMAQACDLIANLAATFANLRRFNIRLNPEKCVFGFQRESC